jgi:hypothetical protein
MNSKVGKGSWFGSRLVGGEDGTIMLGSLVILMFLLLFIGISANVIRTSRVRLEVQNAADEAAYNAAIPMARALNMLTAINHITGELVSGCVLHTALGGDVLDGTTAYEGKPNEDVELPRRVRMWYRFARMVSAGAGVAMPNDQAPAIVSRVREISGAIKKADVRLKQVLEKAYTAHAFGALMTRLRPVPIVGPAIAEWGRLVAEAAVVFEDKTIPEMKALDALEEAARNTMAVKQFQYAAAPALSKLADRVPDVFTAQADRATSFTATFHHGEIARYPSVAVVPVIRESLNVPVTRSQMVRAATPWIQHFRRDLMRFGEDALTLSRFKAYYLEETNAYTTTLVDRLRTNDGMEAYILKDLDLVSADKGAERWRWDPRRADELFGHLSFAWHTDSRTDSFRFLGPTPFDEGILTYSQIMVYNAGGLGRIQAGWQSTNGWDTLNWGNEVPDYPGPGTSAGAAPIPNVPVPRVKINWQVKLMPASRMLEPEAAFTGAEGKMAQAVRLATGSAAAFILTH